MAKKEHEQKDNSGVLFINERKETDKHPDRTGTAMIDGVMYWVAGWVNESKSGKKYMSLKFTEQQDEEKGNNSKGRQSRQQGDEDIDDDIPF